MNLLRTNSINAQIVFAFFTLTALIIALEVLAYSWIREVLVINSLKESSSLLKEKQMQMKSASNEFILREKTNELFFASGKSVFLDRYNSFLDLLRKNLDELQLRVAALDNANEEEIAHLKTTIEAYNEVFLQMVEKIKSRGYGRYGLIGEFDKSISTLLQYDFGIDKAAVLNLQLFVKDYLLTGDEKRISNISNEIFNFTMVLEKHVADEDVEKVSDILINYETIFKQLTKVDRELGIYTGKGLQSRLFSAIDDLDKSIQLESINARINTAHAKNLFKLYLSFFLVVGAAVIAAFIINRKLFKTLVRPIQQMKFIIASMSRGAVPKVNMHFKIDDLNEMAMALNNLMTGTRHYQDFANHIGSGNLDAAFSPLSDQDILGNALLAMRDCLKINAEEERKQNWAAQGLAEMGALLRSPAATAAELYNSVLQFIVKYTGCNQGSLFLLNEDGAEKENYLELVACYAWERKKYVEKRIELGEGFVGQCALDHEVIHMTDIPQNYIKITSGLGHANPNALLIVPLKVNDRFFGVLEIAAFKKFEKYQINLIQKFSENVAAAVNAERINRKTKWLLHQAQQQAEQLRAQEEELRQNMEELETTQEQMKRKLNEVDRERKGYKSVGI